MLSGSDEIIYKWISPDGTENSKKYSEMTKSEKIEWAKAFHDKKKIEIAGLSKLDRIRYTIDNTPWPFIRDDIWKALYLFTAFQLYQTYNLIVQAEPNALSFSMALISWASNAVALHSLRTLVYFNISTWNVTLTVISFSLTFLVSILCYIVGAVALNALSSGSSTFSIFNDIYYIVGNALAILMNLLNIFIFNRLRARVLSETASLASKDENSLSSIALA